MPKSWREFESAGLVFFPEKFDDFIFPHGLEIVVEKIGMRNPRIPTFQGQSANGCGKVDVEIPF